MVTKRNGRPGRPPHGTERKRAISVLLPPDLITWMNEHKSLGSRGVIIEKAIRETLIHYPQYDE